MNTDGEYALTAGTIVLVTSRRESFKKILEQLAQQAEFLVCTSLDAAEEYLSAADGMIIDCPSVGVPEEQTGRALRMLPVLVILPENCSLQCKRNIRNLGAELLLRWPVDEIDIELFVSRFCEPDSVKEFRVPYLRRILDIMGLGIAVIDQYGIYEYVNAAYARLIGYTPEEIIGRSFDAFISPECRKLFAEQLQLRREQQAGVYECEMVRKTGETVQVLVAAVPMDPHASGAGGGITAAIDITELKETQQSLRKREGELTALINHVPGFFYRCACDEHWTMRFVSSSCKAITGYAPEDLIGSKAVSYNSLIDESFRSPIRKRWQEVTDRGGLFEYEYPITAASGQRIWVWERGWATTDEVTGKLVLEGFITDISSRKETEESLRENQELYRSLVETFPDGMILLDLEGRVVFANRQMTDILGCGSPKRIVGEHGFRGVFPPDVPAVRRMWNQLLGGNGRVTGREASLRRSGGGIFPAEIHAVVLQDQAGQPFRVMMVIRDITEQRETQLEHQLLTEQLYESRRMETVENLAGGIAHDFNNMLGVIIGYLELMLDEQVLDTRYTDFLMEMRTAAYRSADLTRHLLACAGQQRSCPRVLSVNDAVNHHVSVFERLADGVTLTFFPEEELKPVRIDPDQLDQILEHMLQNALESMQDNGEIRVSTRNMSCKYMSTAASEHYVTIAVRDTGAGISEGALKKIYEPYFTTKSGKAGLGLPIVYGIVRQNGGVITITSTPGEGTLVEVNLPAAVLPEFEGGQRS